MKYKGIIYILILTVLVSCEPNLKEDFNYSSGKADLSSYVAIGNSLTAGFADAALYTSGQENSFPAILAGQFKLVGGGDFKQPLINTEEGVGISSNGGIVTLTTKYKLGLVEDKDCSGQGTGEYSLKPVFVDPDPDPGTLFQQLYAPPLTPGPYNNVGVPGAMIQHLLFNQYGNKNSPFSNPYFVRFASHDTTTVIADAMLANPTFFSLWIGSNDILGSALVGSDNGVTPTEIFAEAYELILDNIFAVNSDLQGILINIPEIHSIPFFTTISASLPWNGLVLDEEQALMLTQIYEQHGHPEISFQAGPNAFVVFDAGSNNYSRTEEGDLFLLTLPTDKIKCEGLGSASTSTLSPNPIPDMFILDKDEQASINASIQAYNNTINTLAAQYDLPVLDAFSIMQDFESGMAFDGISFSTRFIEGGLFSLDAIHLNARGNALLANYMIEAINAHYEANIPQVIVGNYPGIVFP
ncbi:MAG: hypothetical protein K9G58_09165 [Bacteroidales bacterium]|nr:hypothetical protein [Bacteroidales bacterium]MCF8398325.1 hypothetical protein [Bacteroidales bacterium]